MVLFDLLFTFGFVFVACTVSFCHLPVFTPWSSDSLEDDCEAKTPSALFHEKFSNHLISLKGSLSRGLSRDQTRSDVEPLKNEQVCAPSGAKTPPSDFESIIEKGEVHTGTHRSHMQIFCMTSPWRRRGVSWFMCRSQPPEHVRTGSSNIFFCQDSKNRLFFEK